MKRLMICMLMGCGASQGDAPDTANPCESPVVAATQPPTTPSLDASVRRTLSEPLERRLYPQKFAATSHLQNDWNKFQENYLADYLGDDDPATSWTEGKPDVGLGERVMVEHTPLDDATRLRLEIRNGYQKSASLFRRNARAKEITLTLRPSGATSKHTLKDAEGWQSITVDQPKGALQGYEIRFDSVYKGTHYEDLVVSDIQTYVTSLTPDNPGYETSKQKRLLDWVSERKLAAKTFKEAAKGSMPVASSYGASSVKESKIDCQEGECALPFARAAETWGDAKPLFASLQAAAEEDFAGWKNIRISTTDKRKIPQADHFRFPGSWYGNVLIYEGDEPEILLPANRLMAYLSAKNLKRVYVETSPVSAKAAIEGKAPGCKQEDQDTHHFFTPDTDGPLRTLLISTCGLYEERDGYSTGKYWQLLTYGDNGELSHIVDFFSASKFTWTTKNGAPFLASVMRVSSAGADDTLFTAK